MPASFPVPRAPTPPLELFHELFYKSFCVFVTYKSGLPLQGVTDTHRYRHVHVFVYEVVCGLFSASSILIRLEVVKDKMRMCLCLFLRILFFCFFIFALPFLNNTVSRFSEPLCSFKCRNEYFFSCLAVAYFGGSVAIAAPAAVISAPVVLKNCLRFRGIPVDRSAKYISLAAMPTHGVVYVYSQGICRFLKPAYCRL